MQTLKSGILKGLIPLAYIASWLYRAGVALHRWSYTVLRRPTRLNAHVIVVGNLTTGGTGKTPVVMDLAQHLKAQGKRVAILSRGYKAQTLEPPQKVTPQHTPAQVGDEPYLMAQTLPDIPVWVDPKRSRSGQQAARQADTLLLDDGFQHHALQSDHRIVLIDAQTPFGNGHCLPLGRLREPIQALSRATHIVFTHCPQAPPQQLVQTVRQHNPLAPLYRCFPQATHLLSWPDLQKHPLDKIKGQRLGLFCGLGNPERFQALARSALPCTLAFCQNFADHHTFTPQEIEALERRALLTGVHALLTTQKDAVRLPSPLRNHSLPLWVLPLELVWPDGLPFCAGLPPFNPPEG